MAVGSSSFDCPPDVCCYRMFHSASASHACFPLESPVASGVGAWLVGFGAEAHQASAVEEYIHGAKIDFLYYHFLKTEILRLTHWKIICWTVRAHSLWGLIRLTGRRRWIALWTRSPRSATGPGWWEALGHSRALLAVGALLIRPTLYTSKFVFCRTTLFQ